jgi:flavin-dependent dehydrogenase
MLLHRRFLSRVRQVKWEGIVAALGTMNPGLGRRLARLEPVDDVVQAVSQVPMVPKERAAGGLLFIGDAAGMIAPLCGDGQAMALESAVLLAGLVGGLPRQLSRGNVERLSRSWDATWRRWFAWRVRLGRAFQAALLRPHAADLCFALLETAPSLKNHLVRATRGR